MIRLVFSWVPFFPFVLFLVLEGSRAHGDIKSNHYDELGTQLGVVWHA